MNKKIWIVALMVLLIFSVGICLTIVIYFMKREKRVAEKIQSMLDDAISGKFQEKHLNESRISQIENNMWRYLCDHEVAVSALKKEQEQIQVHISDISHQSVLPISNIVLYSQLLEEWIDMQTLEEKQEIKNELAAIREQAEKLDFLIE